MKLTLLIFISLLFGTISVSGQSVCHRYSTGTDFWIGFMENSVDNRSVFHDFDVCKPDHFGPLHYGEITVTSLLGSDFWITIGPLNKPYMGTFHVNALGSEKVTIDLDSIPKDEAIHLTSERPVSVYALNFNEFTSDIAMIYPTPSLGKEYYTMCYHTPYEAGLFEIPVYWDGWKRSGTPNDPNSEFLIVATESGTTTINITPKVTTSEGWPAGVPHTITLSAGQQYLVKVIARDTVISGRPGKNRIGDLSGSYIISNRKIAVFSGCNWARVIQVHGRYSGHLYEQMPPLGYWGKKFVAVPFKQGYRDTWQIVASVDSTVVHYGSGIINLKYKGDVQEFQLNDSTIIESNNPVLLAQYHGADTEYFGISRNLPTMVVVNPVNQTTGKLAFTAYEFTPWSNSLTADCDTSNAWISWDHGDRITQVTYFNEKTDTSICKYFINVIVKDDAVGKINLDGVNLSFHSLPGTGYSFIRKQVRRGPHLLESTEVGKGFVAYAHNYWGEETRSYPLGFDLEMKLDLAAINNLKTNPALWCFGDSLRGGEEFDYWNWDKGEKTPYILPGITDLYKLTVSTKDGCILKDSVQLLVDRPIVPLDSVRMLCRGDTAVLDAGSEFREFNWTTGDTIQKISTSMPGKYGVVVTNLNGCKAKSLTRVSLVEKPKPDYSNLDPFLCGKIGILDVKTDKGTFSVERLSDHFIFNGLNVEVPDFAVYPLKIRTTDGLCFRDSVVQIDFRKIPLVDISVDDAKCFGYNLNAGYIGNADRDNSEFVWIFSGDTILKAVGADSVVIPLGINRNSRYLKLKVTDAGCPNEKILSNINVIPLLSFSVDDSVGCKPFSAQFRANNTESVTYDWDFGDGSKLTGTANPLHTYENTGYYTVLLKVKSNGGCTNEVRFDDMIFVPPNPDAVFSLEDRTLANFHHEVNFSNSSTGATNYLWDFGDGTTSNDVDPLHLYTRYGYKIIVLHAFNEFACPDTTSRTIMIELKNLFPPTAFSPNAPDQIDREFKLTTEGLVTEGYHFVVLSRWNDIVFETKNEIKGWDGRMKNGEFAPAGSYLWLLDFVDFLGKSHHQTGAVTLIY